jgi:1-acyl-sn-glycerol-3-phosphate acyltransferase
VRNKVPVVPVVIEGTRDILPKNQAYIRPRLVKIRLLDPVHPDMADRDYRRLSDMVRDRMQRELDKMRGNGESGA